MWNIKISNYVTSDIVINGFLKGFVKEEAEEEEPTE